MIRAAQFLAALCIAAATEDASILVQTKLHTQAREPDHDHSVELAEALYPASRYFRKYNSVQGPDQALKVLVKAKLTANRNPCPRCWETGFEMRCRGKSLKFLFSAGKSYARVIGRFPRQSLGWTPALHTYHNLTVTLRSNGIHTFKINDGAAGSTRSWQKDFKRMNFFPETAQQLARCKIRTARQCKRLSLGVEKCYTKSNFDQQHCMKLANNPTPYALPMPYQGTFPAMPESTVRCKAKGDPHYTTYTGVRYNFQGNGTYSISKIDSGALAHTVQAYNCPIPGISKKLSQAVALAVQLHNNVISFYRGWVFVNGVNVTDFNQTTLGYGVKMDYSDGVLIVEGPGRVALQVQLTMRYVERSALGYVLNIQTQLPGDAVGSVTGLCRSKGVEGPSFVPVADTANLFTASQLSFLEQACCPNGGCMPDVGPPLPDPTAEEICAACSPPVPYADAVANCSDAEVPADCELDYCGSCGDEETVLAIGEGQDDPEEPIGGGDPGANADPHCRNLRGEAFDILQLGEMEMVRVPRGGFYEGSDFYILAFVEPLRHQRCAPTVIRRVTISGSWLPNPTAPGQMLQNQSLVITTGGDKPEYDRIWRKYDLGGERDFSFRVTEWKGQTSVTVTVRGVTLNVHQRTGHRSGESFLDITVKGLESLGKEAGGLLGLDTFGGVSGPLKGCELSRNSLKLSEASEEAGDSEGIDQPPMLSVAYAA